MYLELSLSCSPRSVADGERHDEQRGEQFGLPVCMDGKTKGVLGMWKQFRRAVSLIFICGF